MDVNGVAERCNRIVCRGHDSWSSSDPIRRDAHPLKHPRHSFRDCIDFLKPRDDLVLVRAV